MSRRWRSREPAKRIVSAPLVHAEPARSASFNWSGPSAAPENEEEEYALANSGGSAFLSAAVASRAGARLSRGLRHAQESEGHPLICDAVLHDQETESDPPYGAADVFVAAAFSPWTSISSVALNRIAGRTTCRGRNAAISSPTLTERSRARRTSICGHWTLPWLFTTRRNRHRRAARQGAGAGRLLHQRRLRGPHNFTTGGNIAHAFVVINGVCAATNAQLPDVQSTGRVLGRILGLGWSQSQPERADTETLRSTLTLQTSADALCDPISCVPLAFAIPMPPSPKWTTPRARTTPSKQRDRSRRRNYGSVYFTDASGNACKPMQGVNVVARLLVSGQPSGSTCDFRLRICVSRQGRQHHRRLRGRKRHSL